MQINKIFEVIYKTNHIEIICVFYSTALVIISYVLLRAKPFLFNYTIYDSQ